MATVVVPHDAGSDDAVFTEGGGYNVMPECGDPE